MPRRAQLEFHLNRKAARGGIAGMALLAVVLFAVALWPIGDDTPSGLRDLAKANTGVCDFILANPALYPDGCPAANPAAKPRDAQDWGILFARVFTGWVGLLCLGLIARMVILLRHQGAILTLSPAGAEGAFLPSKGVAWGDITRISLGAPEAHVARPLAGTIRVSLPGIARVEIIPASSATALPLRWLLLWPKGLAITSAAAKGPFAEVADLAQAHAPGRVSR